MEGVILYADDHVFDNNEFVNKLFNKFNSDGNYSILPINNLNVLEKAVSSISTFKAIILDWNFKRELSEEDKELGVKATDENPLSFLRQKTVYSLIYIYSQEDLPEDIIAELQALYPNKIFFDKKDITNDLDNEFEKITKGIRDFEDKNGHLVVPFVWGKAINEASQKIFSELESADKFWIKELYYSSARGIDKAGIPKAVEVEPTIEVINLFQNILSERLIQNVELKDAITDYSIKNFTEIPGASAIINLYSKLYYTKTLVTDTVMTGDVYLLKEDCYGIIISPECDMMKLIKKNELVEMICFCKDDFKNNINSFCKSQDEIKRAYNQEIAAIHLLPIFPFAGSEETALIDFRFSLTLVKGKYLETRRQNRSVKINTPYIQQLRQRYLSYIGRVGVPTIPDSLRTVN
ncbi:hypothetical protein EZL74_08545 [Flavobacterium silvisoli]|uniref:Uncharacterized protein n=1 Tax=Flavobacterium silvisoli TaxID=2529433 RepID=A0A4Q9YX19_9FLAO|nr:hypothetical protein [Flavobacterium silvisoli]TBX68350.1 hypothetical protein EZL74_08545 [Flavobacterium silvisoli]